MDFTNIDRRVDKVINSDTLSFQNSSNSYKNFITELEVNSFRQLKNIKIKFECPVTVISGTNKIGKTTILLILACSHEKFMRLDASKPEPTWREHAWKDALAFTAHETEENDYRYSLKWRVGNKNMNGEGKRLASSKSWSGLGKKSKDKRTNAKIKDREVRLIDLERLLPARSFSASLLRKSASINTKPINNDIVKAFCYTLELPYSASFQIHELGGHVNKRCYLIKSPNQTYSSYGAASGEESLINLLRDIIEAPNDSLILIDELEAGFHPAVQRKLAKVICQIAWDHKKQFVITTHSSTIIDAMPKSARKFIEQHNGDYRTISGIAPQAALSKMDAIGHPLIRLFCEDDLAEFLIRKVMIEIAKEHKNFSRLFEIIRSGAASEVKNDYERHRFFFSQIRNKIGYCAVIDGDHRHKTGFKELSDEEFVHFLTPYKAPEKALGKAYLDNYPSEELETFYGADNHHAFFKKMVSLDLATSVEDAKNVCYTEFKSSHEYEQHFSELKDFLIRVASKFSAA